MCSIFKAAQLGSIIKKSKAQTRLRLNFKSKGSIILDLFHVYLAMSAFETCNNGEPSGGSTGPGIKARPV